MSPTEIEATPGLDALVDADSMVEHKASSCSFTTTAKEAKADVRGKSGANSSSQSAPEASSPKAPHKPQLRIDTDIPRPLFVVKVEDEKPRRFPLFKDESEQMENDAAVLAAGNVKGAFKVPVIMVNGQAWSSPGRTNPSPLSTPARQWLEKRGKREKGRWIETWRAI